MDGVVAKGDADADEPVDTVSVGGEKCPPMIRLGMKVCRAGKIEAPCRKDAISDTELVLVASHGVDLCESSSRKKSHEAKNNTVFLHIYGFSFFKIHFMDSSSKIRKKKKKGVRFRTFPRYNSKRTNDDDRGV